MCLLTFIIPVRHHANSRDWALLKANLAQAVGSIASQTRTDWRGLVVCNEGSDVPKLPPGFEAVRVDFPPNASHERGNSSPDDFFDAFRIDKGRRVLKGMLAATDSRYFMIVDDDDLVSARIVDFVGRNNGGNGWKIDRGYVWDDGGRWLFQHNTFNQVCGTSLIVRSDLYGLPDTFEDASPEWIKSMLGSHVRIASTLEGNGTPLATLPFRGAVYRVANRGSHSQTPGISKKFFLNKSVLSRPSQFARNLCKLRVLSSSAQREFFGSRDNLTGAA